MNTANASSQKIDKSYLKRAISVLVGQAALAVKQDERTEGNVKVNMGNNRLIKTLIVITILAFLIGIVQAYSSYHSVKEMQQVNGVASNHKNYNDSISKSNYLLSQEIKEDRKAITAMVDSLNVLSASIAQQNRLMQASLNSFKKKVAAVDVRRYITKTSNNNSTIASADSQYHSNPSLPKQKIETFVEPIPQ